MLKKLNKKRLRAAATRPNLVRGQVFRAKFKAQWHALLLPVVPLPARRAVITVVENNANAGGTQAAGDIFAALAQCTSHFVGVGDFVDVHDHDLLWRDAWRQHKALVVSMDHHHDTDL